VSKQEREKKKREPGRGGRFRLPAKVQGKGKKIKEDLDKLMDEVDDVLEKCEEFVKTMSKKVENKRGV
jgi:ubiquitin-like protein Pup